MQLHHAHSLPLPPIEPCKIIYRYNGGGRTLLTIGIYWSFPYWGILMVGMTEGELKHWGIHRPRIATFNGIGLSETTIIPSNRSFDWNASGFAVGVRSDVEVDGKTNSTGHKCATDDSRSKAQTTTAQRQAHKSKEATTPSADKRQTERGQRQAQRTEGFVLEPTILRLASSHYDSNWLTVFVSCFVSILSLPYG